MTQVDKNIATNLKRIRKNKNLSLDMMAEKTGVSKSMLGQIERGESNPTVATISIIVEGLKISFEELLYVKSEELLLVDDNQISPYREKDGKYQIKVLFPYDRNRQFEMFSIYEILPQLLELWGDNMMTEVHARKNLAAVQGK